MNKKNNLEFVLGLFILFISVILFFYLTSKITFFKIDDKFSLDSSFLDIGSLEVGGEVKISGVKVGEVTQITLDETTYLASVITDYQRYIKIPKDSSFTIANSGFVGSPYIEISLGISDEYYLNNQETENNIDAISLEEIINNFIFK